jgi:hypothetical protein
MSVSVLPEVDWLLGGWQKANYRPPDPQPKASGKNRHLGITPKFGLENGVIPQVAMEPVSGPVPLSSDNSQFDIEAGARRSVSPILRFTFLPSHSLRKVTKSGHVPYYARPSSELGRAPGAGGCHVPHSGRSSRSGLEGGRYTAGSRCVPSIGIERRNLP